MSSLVELFKSFGIGRVAAIVGVTLGVAIALTLIMVRIGEPRYSVLYSELDYTNAQTIISQLEQSGTDFKMRESGSRVAILVPQDEISSLRVSLAGSNAAISNSIGYEIFDGQQPLGATSFQQNINRLRALEGELARTVSSIANVRSARVHLVMPERTLFTRDQADTKASIMVESANKLDARTVRAIINLAASAVPELNAENITILDANGNLLASAQGKTDDAMAEELSNDRMLAAQTRLQQKIVNLVGSIVGSENVRAQVTGEFDISRFTETAEIVDPDSQVVLSSTLVEESSNDQNPSANRGVSVGNALPGEQSASTNNAAATSSNRRTEEITNYEITKTIRNAIRDEGLVVKRLSVAVAINANDSNGDPINRSPEELARLDSLIKSAVGFNPSRGDQVEIIDIAFTPIIPATTPFTAAPSGKSIFDNVNISRIAELAALFLIAIALVIFVLKPMISRAPHPDMIPDMANTGLQSNGAHQTSSTIALTPTGTSLETATDANANLANANLIEQRINIAQVEGQVRAASINQIQEIVKGHSDESALVLKRWIRQAL